MSDSSQLPAAVKCFQVDQLSVRLYHQETELTQDVAAIAGDYLQNVLARQSQAAVILATGNSQIKFLDALIKLGDVDWSRIVFFHLDEYLGIDANHSASFRRYLQQKVEQRVNPAAFHYIEGDAMQPIAECDRYAQLLQAQPIDLCCLGVGENGHLAFNEPSVADFNDSRQVKLVKLELATRQQQVSQEHFPSIEAVPQYAFTLTIKQICESRKIICLAPGEHKAAIVKKMLRSPISCDCPASVLRSLFQATLFLDADAASELGDF